MFNKQFEGNSWQKHYLAGVGTEMYTEFLSSSFVNQTFPDVCKFVFRLYTCNKVIVLALEL